MISKAREWSGVVAFLVLLSVSLIVANVSSHRAAEQDERLRVVAVTTNSALCSFRADLQRRLDDTVRYMRQHPGREPIPGITRATLRRSVEGQRATLDALSILACP